MPYKEARFFTKEECVQLESLAAFLSLPDIAGYFGISVECLEDVRRRQPEVETFYKRGVANARTRVASKLLKYVDDPELNQPNLSATIFYLKTRGGWVDASKFIEREMFRVKQDLIDIKYIEDPAELVNKIDRAIEHIDSLMKKEGSAAS